MGTLGLLYAQLELQCEMLRSVTPFYTTFTLKEDPSNPDGWRMLMADKSTEAMAIRKHWKHGHIWMTVCLSLHIVCKVFSDG